MGRFTNVTRKIKKMNHKKVSIICIIVFFVFFTQQIYAYQQDIVIKYDKIFSSKVLSDEDVYNYQQAYKFQDKCKWKSANNFILKIKNKSLLGHIYAHKFLHPNCYRSKYLELYYWLKKYNDHPQAKQIYKLAISRFNLVPEETLFIDDREENIHAAQNLGFQTIHLTDPSTIKSDIKNFLVV